MKSYVLYHRAPQATFFTQTMDEEGGQDAKIYADSEESLEELETKLREAWRDGFVSRYPTTGSLVAVEFDDLDEGDEVASWSIEELGRVQLGLGDLRSWMARIPARLGRSRWRGGISAKEAAQAFLWCLGKIEKEMIEQDWGWAKGALKASPELASALLWSRGNWLALDLYEAACGVDEWGEERYWASWQRNSPGLVAHHREELELYQQLAQRLGHLGLSRPPRLEWVDRFKAPEQVAHEVLAFLCQAPVPMDAQPWWEAQLKTEPMSSACLEALRAGWNKLEPKSRVKLNSFSVFSTFDQGEGR